jgi:hypothetical protein
MTAAIKPNLAPNPLDPAAQRECNVSTAKTDNAFAKTSEAALEAAALEERIKKLLEPTDRQQQAPPPEPSFVDPYAEFVGPVFPLDVLPPTLAKFVDAEHSSMGADPSAIAMAVLTTVAGAMHAETRVRAGEGWWERPLLWTVLVGRPSAMKSPIMKKRQNHSLASTMSGLNAGARSMQYGSKTNTSD